MIPFLQSMGIQYTVIEDGVRLEEKIKDAVRMMHALKSPVALLFTGEFTI
jgi:deoxyxylulose-5-phosphate synthase